MVQYFCNAVFWWYFVALCLFKGGIHYDGLEIRILKKLDGRGGKEAHILSNTTRYMFMYLRRCK